jgi:hypothetical protein
MQDFTLPEEQVVQPPHRPNRPEEDKQHLDVIQTADNPGEYSEAVQKFLEDGDHVFETENVVNLADARGQDPNLRPVHERPTDDSETQ